MATETHIVEVVDPTTGETHTFTGDSEAAADAAADEFFGVNDADTGDAGHPDQP